MRFFIITAIVMIIVSLSAIGQENTPISPLSDGHRDVRVYVATDVAATTVFGDAAGLFSMRGAVVFNSRWSVGLRATALWYDKALNQLSAEGTYHFNVGYAGIYVERAFPLGDAINLSLSIFTGTGVAEYLYDKEYRKDMLWTEEVIDRTTFAVFEPGVEISVRLSRSMWLGAHGSIRNTSPIELLGTPEGVLRKASGGLTLKYEVF